MAINQNHPFEDLDGVKCAIVEKNVSKQRLEFVRILLESNGYKVIAIPTPQKAPAAAAPPSTSPSAETPVALTPPPAPVAETFTVGVTDVTFNVTNAIFGRLLKTRDGKVVTLAYWQQRESVPDNSKPYFY